MMVNKLLNINKIHTIVQDIEKSICNHVWKPRCKHRVNGLGTGFIGQLHSLQHLWLQFTLLRSRQLAQLQPKIYSAIAIIQLQSKVHYNTQWVLLVCCPSLVLRYRHPTADVRLPGFPNCPYRTATATLDSQCTHWNCLLLSRTILSGDLSITNSNWTPVQCILHYLAL
jgi:hypothetical protein